MMSAMGSLQLPNAPAASAVNFRGEYSRAGADPCGRAGSAFLYARAAHAAIALDVVLPGGVLVRRANLAA